MADATVSSPVEKNAAGGLNLNWAIRQALDKIGVNAKHGEVKDFIEREYGKLGKEAAAKNASLSTGLSVMRKKLRRELASSAPVKVGTNMAASTASATLAKAKNVVAAKKVVAAQNTPASELLKMQRYVIETLKPAMEVIEAAGGLKAWPRLQALVKACEIG